MKEIIQWMIGNPFFAASLTVIIASVKSIINGINMREVEKLFLTNMEKSLRQISILMIIIVFYTIVLLSLTYNGDVEITPFLLASLFIVMIITITVYLIMVFLVNIFSYKWQYYLYLKDFKGKWYITRKVSKKEILLRKKRNNKNNYYDYLYYDEEKVKKEIIYSEIIEKKAFVKKIFKIVEDKPLLIIIILVVLEILFVALSEFLSFKFAAWVALVTLIFIILFIIIFINNIFYKNTFSNSTQNNTRE